MKRCTKCNSFMPDDVSRCIKCGFAPAPIAEAPNAEGPESLYPALLGASKRSYYLARFAEIEAAPHFKPSWNWGAFVFGFWWLVYRRMYSYAAAGFGFVLGMASLSSGHPFDVMLLPQVMTYQLLFGEDIYLSDVLYTLAAHVALPVCANPIYYRHLRRKSERLWDTHPDPADLQAAVAGESSKQSAPPLKTVRNVVLTLFFSAMALFLLAGFVIGRNATQEMEKVAPAVIGALDGYRTANGSYPKSLDDLVPAYLAQRPTCGVASRRPVGYMLGTKPATGEAQPGEYELYCPAFMFMRHGYSSKTKAWYSWD